VATLGRTGLSDPFIRRRVKHGMNTYRERQRVLQSLHLSLPICKGFSLDELIYFSTDHDHIGLCPALTEPGDWIVVARRMANSFPFRGGVL
jgi:hypothetical protein